MYVAITRARKRLYLSHSQTRMLHGQTRYNLKSRFFDELPEARTQVDHAKEPGLCIGHGGAAAPGAVLAIQELVARAGTGLQPLLLQEIRGARRFPTRPCHRRAMRLRMA